MERVHLMVQIKYYKSNIVNTLLDLKNKNLNHKINKCRNFQTEMILSQSSPTYKVTIGHW